MDQATLSRQEVRDLSVQIEIDQIDWVRQLDHETTEKPVESIRRAPSDSDVEIGSASCLADRD
jgi:hypothetical protein